jgi:hypothetical protein
VRHDGLPKEAVIIVLRCIVEDSSEAAVTVGPQDDFIEI